MTRIYYPQARTTLALVPYDATGPAAARELITLPDLQPISATVVSNTIAEADTFDVELEERYFPTDPRLFRAVALDLYMGDMGSLDGTLAANAQTRVMLGHSDEVSKSFSTSQGSTVTFKGRDYKGLLLDEKWQGRSVVLGQRLDDAFRLILDSIPSAAPLSVLVELEDGVPAPVLPVGRGRKGKVWRAVAKDPVWRAMINLALMVGVTVNVRGDAVVIRPARTVDLSSATVPILSFGNNLIDLKMSRKFGTRGVPNVRVVSLDLDTGRTIRGDWPPTPTPTRRVTSSKTGKKKKKQILYKKYVINHPAPTADVLKQIARQIFERMAQQQVKIEFTIFDLRVPVYQPRRSSGQAEGRTIAATEIRNGTPVHLVFDPEVERILRAPNLSSDGRRRKLREANFNARVAAVMARGAATIQTPFFVDRATHKMDASSGYALSVSASAYMTVDLDRRLGG